MKGISKRTTKLGFHVLRLHYSADPDKDPATEAGKKWYEEARRSRGGVAETVRSGALPRFPASAFGMDIFQTAVEIWFA